jgi:hypothetical protein
MAVLCTSMPRSASLPHIPETTRLTALKPASGQARPHIPGSDPDLSAIRLHLSRSAW